jgi:hypothetical protein
VIDKIKAAAMAAAAAVVGDYEPLLGTPGNPDDDSTQGIAALIEREMVAVLLPTVIDGAEVWDSDGTLALTVNGYDVLYLSKCKPEAPGHPVLTDEQHQRIIDVIVEALGVQDTPRPFEAGAKVVTEERADLDALKAYKPTSFP